MKILLVSMPSLHFFRWTEQLEHSGHEVYWFDIVDGAPTERLPWVHKIRDWKLKYPNLKGRHFIKKKWTNLYRKFSALIENNTEEFFEKIIKDIQPDVVHSFVLYLSCTPILSVMNKFKNLPWIYSSWGSDLYYFKEIQTYKQDILKVLPRVNYLFTDCKRDFTIAKALGFNGVFLGVFPGGGGFDYDQNIQYILPVSERKTILIKGYQGRSGRAIEVFKALQLISKDLQNYHIIVFGTDDEAIKYIKECKLIEILSIEILPRKSFLPHDTILELMGSALVYVGNSNSDGMPNTLLEAIIMGAFPIQSNPGGATAEIIVHGKNGFLIDNYENSSEIADLLKRTIKNLELVNSAFLINQQQLKPNYDREFITASVLSKYSSIKDSEL